MCFLLPQHLNIKISFSQGNAIAETENAKSKPTFNKTLYYCIAKQAAKLAIMVLWWKMLWVVGVVEGGIGGGVEGVWRGLWKLQTLLSTSNPHAHSSMLTGSSVPT